MRIVRKTVRLAQVPKGLVELSIRRLHAVYRKHGVPEETQDEIWQCFAIFTTHCLLRNGVLPPGQCEGVSPGTARQTDAHDECRRKHDARRSGLFPGPA